jgi:hypothetical protein
LAEKHPCRKKELHQISLVAESLPNQGLRDTQRSDGIITAGLIGNVFQGLMAGTAM